MNDQSKRILYLEDDESLSFLTKDQLQDAGFKVDHCTDGRQAIKTFTKSRYDLCILDVMVPTLDGFEVAKQIRAANHEIPIIFLSAKSQKEDRIAGLKTGGDDYLTKPFSIDELLLKIDVFLRRKNIAEAFKKDEKYTVGKFELDFSNLVLKGPSGEQALTLREAELIRQFATNLNIVMKREEILMKVWGNDDYFLGRSMDVFISRLRKFFKDDASLKLENIHGVGFILRSE